jgi:hypothetical protein
MINISIYLKKRTTFRKKNKTNLQSVSSMGKSSIGVVIVSSFIVGLDGVLINIVGKQLAN